MCFFQAVEEDTPVDQKALFGVRRKLKLCQQVDVSTSMTYSTENNLSSCYYVEMFIYITLISH